MYVCMYMRYTQGQNEEYLLVRSTHVLNQVRSYQASSIVHHIRCIGQNVQVCE